MGPIAAPVAGKVSIRWWAAWQCVAAACTTLSVAHRAELSAWSHHWRRGARIGCQRLDGVCSCLGATEFWCRHGSYLAEKSKVLVQMKGASLCKSLKIKDFPSENMPSYLLSLLQKSAPNGRFFKRMEVAWGWCTAVYVNSLWRSPPPRPPQPADPETSTEGSAECRTR